ncbi:MAG TPA: cellulose biosynthesis protein BcsO [Scandinavium sp.]|jgi:hypothetical protein|uniref:cellulose biosynthesis protein BcsO n=1 Tax=Scandinavium sp. TaxID=2830653 RepID=UPI002E2ED83F|nr:cellulose biosynthesis protein BcsO [Scandinavium sp.]HEX4503431.1 cellulose biosynthesis protein BcsO [Scandinavium sp.]
MNHYDDLQRFKDKTRTQSLDFKDLSAQNAASERGDWAILDQLSPPAEKETTLAMGGSVSQIVPQPVAADAFTAHDLPPVKATPPGDAIHESHATSIMQSVSSQMAPKVAPVPEEAPIAKPEPVVQAVAPQAEPTLAPAPRPQKPVTPDAVNYSRLFAPKPANIPVKAEKEEKDQPLKSLLERISSCR